MSPKDPEILNGEEESLVLPRAFGDAPPRSTGKNRNRPRQAVRDDPPLALGNGSQSLFQEPGSHDAIYRDVSRLLELGNYRDAEATLTRGLELFPESADLLKELGVLYHLQGHYGKAVRTFNRVMNISGTGDLPLSWKIASLYRKACEELDGPDPGKAVESFDQILHLDPADGEALAGKITALRVLGRTDEAQQLASEGLARSPGNPSILYQQGWIHMDRDRPDLAEGYFDRAASGDHVWPEPVLSRALALERLERAREAARILQDLVARTPGDPGARAQKGWFALRHHDLEEARGIFFQLADGEGDPRGFHGLAAFLFVKGSTGDASAIMRRVAEMLPRDPLVQVNLGMVLARMGGAEDLAESLLAARRALSLDPRLGAAHTCLGIIAFKQGRLPEAENHLLEAARYADPLGEQNLGLLRCQTGSWEEGEALLSGAARRNPRDTRAWTGLGAVALHGKRSGDALRSFRLALDRDPGNREAARGLGIALARSGDITGAEEVFREALGEASGPGRWVLLLDLAALLLSPGSPGSGFPSEEEARELLETAAAIQPGHPGIAFYQGVILARRGSFRAAAERFASGSRVEEYRLPARENIRILQELIRAGQGGLPRLFRARSVLAAIALLHLVALWVLFAGGRIGEMTLAILLTTFSALLALAVLVPAGEKDGREEPSLNLTLPERTFLVPPEAEMVPPTVRLRTALRR